MKKVMLGLVMVVMLMSLVGCGTATKNEESEVTTEMKEVVNGITGEKEFVEDEVDTDEKTMILFAKVVEIEEGRFDDVKRVKFETSIENTVCTFSGEYPTDAFEMGNVVKFVVGVRNYGGPDLPDTNKIISYEIVE